MRIVICWADISGYMAACWRALSRTPGIDLFIIAFQPVMGTGAVAPFDELIMTGLRYRLFTAKQRTDKALIASAVAEHDPDVIVLPGWAIPCYFSIATHPMLGSRKLIMGMDTPWRGEWRQRLARLKIGRYIDRMDRVIVTGERSWQYAKHLKAPEEKIMRGCYGIDHAALSPIYRQRLAQPQWPRRFLYTGRYAPEKGLDVLLDAYKAYRTRVSDPWPLNCCGAGPLKAVLAGRPGVTDRGFVQPSDLPGVMAEHGAFVLASRFDPWPLVVVEACAAGLPVICSEACGSSVELVRSYFNGFPVATGDPAAIATAMEWIDRNHAQLGEMGGRSVVLSAAYSAEMWAQRWASACRQLVAPADT